MEIWFNPSCSKSRAATAQLDAAGLAHTVRPYLDRPPTAAELDATLTALGLQPWEVARTGEPAARAIGLTDLPHERSLWIEAMVAHPSLIQRPIVLTSDGGAFLGRDAAGLAAAVAAERRALAGRSDHVTQPDHEVLD